MGVTLLASFHCIDRVHEKVSSSTTYGTTYHRLRTQSVSAIFKDTSGAVRSVSHAGTVADLPPPPP